MTSASLRRRLGAPAVIVAALLAGCGGSSSSSTSPPASSSAASAPAAAAPGGVAKPGAAFAVGQTATVAYVRSGSLSNKPLTTLAITVQAIQRGTLADFK